MNWPEFLIGRDFKTSMSGLIAAVGQAGLIVGDVPVKYRWIFGIASVVGTVGLGFSAKDSTNHSTLEQVEKATEEAESKKEKL